MHLSNWAVFNVFNTPCVRPLGNPCALFLPFQLSLFPVLRHYSCCPSFLSTSACFKFVSSRSCFIIDHCKSFRLIIYDYKTLFTVLLFYLSQLYFSRMNTNHHAHHRFLGGKVMLPGANLEREQGDDRQVGGQLWIGWRQTHGKKAFGNKRKHFRTRVGFPYGEDYFGRVILTSVGGTAKRRKKSPNT